MTDHLTSCPVCSCCVREDEEQAHLEWHRTLSNIPPRVAQQA